MTESRTATLIKHTGLYAMGNVASKLMMFALVPVYSFYVPADKFGYYGMCLSAVMLLFPVVSMQLRDSALRFLIESGDDGSRDGIIAFIIRKLCVNAVIFMLLAAVINAVRPIEYLWYTVALALAFAFQETCSQICRGLNRNTVFALSGVISAFFILTISVTLVAVLNWGVKGIFIGNIAGRLMAICYMQIRVKIAQRVCRGVRISSQVSKEIWRYSLSSLAIVSLIWVINYSNVFFVNYFNGSSDTGEFAVAQKWGQIFESLAVILYLSWQEMALAHFRDKDSSSYFSKVLNAYIWVYSLAVIIISFGVKFMYPWIVGAEYQSGVVYIFPNVMSIMLCYMVWFYDVAYQCVKRLTRSFVSWTFATITALIGNMVLGYYFGTFGILASSVLTYVALLTFRILDTRKYLNLRWTLKSVVCAAILLMYLVLFYIPMSRIFELGCIGLVVAAFGVLLPPYIVDFIKSKLTSVTASVATDVVEMEGEMIEKGIEEGSERD